MSGKSVGLVAVVSGLIISTRPVSGQPTLPGDSPPRTVAARPVELAESFSGVRGVRALPDGRVIVTDGVENAVYLVDFAASSRTTLSRKGNGPREYQRASLVHPARGGGFLVADPILARFLPIDNSGQVHDAVAYPTVSREVGVAFTGPDLYTPDTLGSPFGNVYRASLSRGAARGDSLTLIRIDRSGEKTDTIARLRDSETRCIQPSPGSSFCRMVDFSPRDLWVVAPDGWVAVARSAPYRVAWHPPRGTGVVGAAITFTPVAVQKAEKDSIVEAAQNPRGPTVTMGGVKPGQPTAQSAPTQPRIEPVILDSKPAFGPFQLLLTDRAGRVWIERHRAFGSKGGRVYDVVDRRGVLVDRIELPPRTKLVAVDGASLFAVRIDDDDLQYLQRFPMP